MVGKVAAKYPQLVKKVYAEGHTIGMHGMEHKDLASLSYEELTPEILKNRKTLENIIKHPVKGLHPAFGYYNQDLIKFAQQQHKQL